MNGPATTIGDAQDMGAPFTDHHSCYSMAAPHLAVCAVPEGVVWVLVSVALETNTHARLEMRRSRMWHGTDSISNLNAL